MGAKARRERERAIGIRRPSDCIPAFCARGFLRISYGTIYLNSRRLRAIHFGFLPVINIIYCDLILNVCSALMRVFMARIVLHFEGFSQKLDLFRNWLTMSRVIKELAFS